MLNFRDEFIKELLETLKIPAGAFNIATVKDEVKDISNEDLRSFYKDVLTADTYGNGMKAIIKTAEAYKPMSDVNIMLSNTKSEAREMYNKFYIQSRAMLDFTQQNRNKYPNDKQFFNSIDYSKLQQTDNTKTYTKKELYVLNEMGGGTWLMDIKLAENSKTVIDKIQNIINKAIYTKYSDVEKISNRRVVKILKGVA